MTTALGFSHSLLPFTSVVFLKKIEYTSRHLGPLRVEVDRWLGVTSDHEIYGTFSST
jgi:hypothetical protein